MEAPPLRAHDLVLMSIILIAGLLVAAVWLVESIVFIAGYKHSLDS